MNSLTSHKFTSIAAAAAALLVSGGIARAADGFRTPVYVAHRAPVVERVAVRPEQIVGYVPARPVFVERAPVVVREPVHVVPAPCPVVVRHDTGWHAFGFWGCR